MVLHEVLMCCKNACRLHCSSAFRAQDAFHLDSSFEVERQAVVADPVDLRDLVDPVTLLVYRDVAVATENNQVLVFVITIVANGTLSVLLHHQASLVRTQRGKAGIKLQTFLVF